MDNVKDIDTLIDYITKCDIEIPKLILALNQLLPDKKIQDAINKLLKGDEDNDREATSKI